MTYPDYVRLVKNRADFSSDNDAQNAIRSVLEVLSGHLTSGKADDLAALLPKELKPYLRGSSKAEQFGLQEFLARVGAKERTDPAIALYHSRAVLSVLAGAVPTNELVEALSQLPNDIRDLFMVKNWVKKAA